MQRLAQNGNLHVRHGKWVRQWPLNTNVLIGSINA
jgi:hypothetical protein